MTLEETVLFVNSQGWTVGSLCQLEKDGWYACLIDDEGYTHTASAETIIGAISIAWERPAGPRLASVVKGVYTLDKDPERQIDLVGLGLVKQREPIKRRF